jgi:hypothetical protein
LRLILPQRASFCRRKKIVWAQFSTSLVDGNCGAHRKILCYLGPHTKSKCDAMGRCIRIGSYPQKIITCKIFLCRLISEWKRREKVQPYERVKDSRFKYPQKLRKRVCSPFLLVQSKSCTLFGNYLAVSVLTIVVLCSSIKH